MSGPGAGCTLSLSGGAGRRQGRGDEAGRESRDIGSGRGSPAHVAVGPGWNLDRHRRSRFPRDPSAHRGLRRRVGDRPRSDLDGGGRPGCALGVEHRHVLADAGRGHARPHPRPGSGGVPVLHLRGHDAPRRRCHRGGCLLRDVQLVGIRAVRHRALHAAHGHREHVIQVRPPGHLPGRPGHQRRVERPAALLGPGGRRGGPRDVRGPGRDDPARSVCLPRWRPDRDRGVPPPADRPDAAGHHRRRRGRPVPVQVDPGPAQPRARARRRRGDEPALVVLRAPGRPAVRRRPGRHRQLGQGAGRVRLRSARYGRADRSREPGDRGARLHRWARVGRGAQAPGRGRGPGVPLPNVLRADPDRRVHLRRVATPAQLAPSPTGVASGTGGGTRSTGRGPIRRRQRRRAGRSSNRSTG